MIVDFSFSNFRSFRTDQLFSLNVQRAKSEHSGNYFSVLDGKIDVLKVSAIYGANASGKTNIFRALMALRWMVLESETLKEGGEIPPYEPFALDDENRNLPINFELEFIDKNSIRYIYIISFNKTRIINESLYSYRFGQKSKIFLKNPGDDWQSMSFGGNYKGGRRRIPFFSNNSYLSKAGNNAASPELIRDVYKYFRSMVFISEDNPSLGTYLNNKRRLKYVSNFLKLVDTGIHSISAQERNDFEQKLPKDMPIEIKQRFIDEYKIEYSFMHENKNGKLVPFNEEDESSGTLRLFRMIPFIIKVIKNGDILIMDEIETSFHPHIVDLIVRLFADVSINKQYAQLIFSTHNQNVINNKNIRRDQIWFVEKNGGSSKLYSLDEYKVRQSVSFGEMYVDGRFGAIPDINYSEIREIMRQALSLDEEVEGMGSED